jgi:hypothetical protein
MALADLVDSVRLYKLDHKVDLGEVYTGYGFGCIIPTDGLNRMLGYSYRGKAVDFEWFHGPGDCYLLQPAGVYSTILGMLDQGTLVEICSEPATNVAFQSRIVGVRQIEPVDFMLICGKYCVKEQNADAANVSKSGTPESLGDLLWKAAGIELN